MTGQVYAENAGKVETVLLDKHGPPFDIQASQYKLVCLQVGCHCWYTCCVVAHVGRSSSRGYCCLEAESLGLGCADSQAIAMEFAGTGNAILLNQIRPSQLSPKLAQLLSRWLHVDLARNSIESYCLVDRATAVIIRLHEPSSLCVEHSYMTIVCFVTEHPDLLTQGTALLQCLGT